VHRTPSTPALTGGEYFPDGPAGGVVASSPASREGLAELWQGFLEQESGAVREKGKEKGRSRDGEFGGESTSK
jgi:hypothetical protein